MKHTQTGGSSLIVKGLARRFGKRWAVAGVDIEVPAGTTVMITGPNGSGKTTLLRCLASALRPHYGTIHLDGEDLWTNRHQLRGRMGFLAHQGRLYEDLSATDNLRIWARLGGHDIDIAERLAYVDLPSHRRDPVRTFSAGMRRRLALAIAWLKTPSFVLLDEPFSAIDPDGRRLMGEVIADMQKAGATIVMSTHLPEEAARFAHRHIHMADGHFIDPPGGALV